MKRRIREVELDDYAGRCYFVPTGHPLRSGDLWIEEEGEYDNLYEIDPDLIGKPAEEERYMRVDTPDDYVIAEWDDKITDEFRLWQTWPTCAGRPYGWVRSSEKHFRDPEIFAKFGKIVSETGDLGRWFVCKPEVKENEVEIA